MHKEYGSTTVKAREHHSSRALNYWLEHVHKFSIRQSTYVMHRGIIRSYKASYVRMMHRILSKALKHAVRIKRMGYNACDQTDRPRIENLH